jgi:hypothetical protein
MLVGWDGEVEGNWWRWEWRVVGGAQEKLSARLSFSDLDSSRLGTEFIFPRKAGTRHNYYQGRKRVTSTMVYTFVDNFFLLLYPNWLYACAGGPAPMNCSSLGRISQNAAEGTEPQIFYAGTF